MLPRRLQVGVVKFFDRRRGYGFITPEESGPEIHFIAGKYHHVGRGGDGRLKLKGKRSPYKPPRAGDEVIYALHRNQRRPRASVWTYLGEKAKACLAKSQTTLPVTDGCGEQPYRRYCRQSEI